MNTPNTLSPLRPTEPVTDANQSFIADLVCLEDRYLYLRREDRDFRIPFSMCNSTVTALEAGDRVMVKPTADGLYVESRLMKDSEAPTFITQNERGETLIKATSALVIQTPQAKLILDQKGNVRLAGENIHLDARRDLKISGAQIRLG